MAGPRHRPGRGSHGPAGLHHHHHRRADHQLLAARRPGPDQVAGRQLRAGPGSAAGHRRAAGRQVRPPPDLPDRPRRLHRSLAGLRPGLGSALDHRGPAGPGRVRGAADPAGLRHTGRGLPARAHRQGVQRLRPDPGAVEWLVDNFPVVEEQIREIIDDLPPGFYRELPKLAEGHLKGYPRILGVAWAFIAHTDSRFDLDWLRRYVRAYQKTHPLYIGEIWALRSEEHTSELQ